MPRPLPHESLKHYTKRFMSNPEAVKDYPDPAQRYAVLRSMFRHKKSKASFVVKGSTEDEDEHYGLDDCSAYQDDMKSMLKDGDVAIV